MQPATPPDPISGGKSSSLALNLPSPTVNSLSLAVNSTPLTAAHQLASPTADATRDSAHPAVQPMMRHNARFTPSDARFARCEKDGPCIMHSDPMYLHRNSRQNILNIFPGRQTTKTLVRLDP